MKPSNTKTTDGGARTALKRTVPPQRQKILRQISQARKSIFAESHRALKPQEHLLRLALNEAESLAWQTAYPHLVFPVLAAEKVQAVIAWNQHQEAVWRTNPISSLAA